MLIHSPILLERGVRHGFSTRQGGVSTGRYATLNPAAKWGDAPELVAENRRRLASAGGFALERLYTARQVHGQQVITISTQLPTEVATSEADALVANVPGTAVGVFTADCVPLLFADSCGRVAAAHAGWRGTVANIAGATVASLVALGATRTSIAVAIGPSICVRCFEVGEEVAAQFDAVVKEAVVRDLGKKPHVDLYLANRRLLIDAGVAASAISAPPPCTRCDAERFFSFRRDGGNIGQQLSFIVAV